MPRQRQYATNAERQAAYRNRGSSALLMLQHLLDTCNCTDDIHVIRTEASVIADDLDYRPRRKAVDYDGREHVATEHTLIVPDGRREV